MKHYQVVGIGNAVVDVITHADDSFLDLIIYFESQQIADAISPVEDGDCLYLTITGFLTDGIRIEGSDSSKIIKKKQDK